MFSYDLLASTHWLDKKEVKSFHVKSIATTQKFQLNRSPLAL